MSTKPDYPPNVTAFVNKWQPVESDSRRKAFWKEFRKAANAYVKFKETSPSVDEKGKANDNP